ncbi:MAG: hypothetical protein WKG06_20245 [Segetibacter sp.]
MDIQAYIQSGIIESYVLGLANAEEAAELENLQFQFPEIQQAVSEFSTLLEQKLFENAITPPMDVKAKIMSAIKNEMISAPVISLSRDAAIDADVYAKPLRLLKMLAAASVILFIASACLNFYLYNRYTQKNEAYQALLTERNTLQANNQIYQTHLQQWQKAAEVMSRSCNGRY